MTFDPRKPYNDLPPLPPKADIETKAVLKKAITAGRALAELKGLGATIPNQSVLVNSLTLQEAKSSSEIENIVTTNDSLFRAFTADTGKIDPATKEVLRYREALWEGFNGLRERPVLTTNLCINLVRTIKKNQAGIRNISGTVISNAVTGDVIYTPPEGDVVIRDKLKNLEDYIHAEDKVDPLVKLALIHYQFESIHPFLDGNGRTGRIINILFLIFKNLLELPVLYLSKYIIENKNDYYRLMRGVTERQEWELWILYMLDAVEHTALYTQNNIIGIRDLMEETRLITKNNLPGRMYSKELIELLFRQPYCKIAFLVNEGIASRNIASSYLNELTKIKILKKEKVGNEFVYLNVPLYELLTK
jgi:Fic family protein